MKSWRIEVSNRTGIFETIGEGIKRDVEDLGINGVEEVKFTQVYNLEGDISEKKIKNICESLLTDSVIQKYKYGSSSNERLNGIHIIEVAYNPGVMDPVEESTKKAIKDLGIEGVSRVKTAKEFLIKGKISRQDLEKIAEKLLCNKVIQHVVKEEMPSHLTEVVDYKFDLIYIDILDADEKELERFSKQGQLFLNLEEMKEIKKYFLRKEKNPTDIELETLAQTWSEHCKHKTFRGLIEYREQLENGNWRTKIIDNLLESTIMKVTEELDKPWCVSVFKDNSGIIDFDQDYDICFKVETHNHPSALEPYGGAGTGIGGVIRDPLGTGLGARPIINTDVFCFGPPDYPHEKLPSGVLHPKRIMKGVVSGVRDYGNRMGIPTSNGAVLFNENYIGNPLVYCGNVGLIPRNKFVKKVDKKDLIVLVGGRTGRDGIHGATFSSGELTSESEELSSSAVQIGNPIQEKKMVDTLIQARDNNLYKAITDCGGGGLSSAVGEMGEDTGVKVNLEKVPLKYKGLSYTEIWISEAQERMILVVKPEKVGELIELFNKEDVEATVIGEFTDTRRLHLLYDGKTVADLEMEFLHHGLPRIKRLAEWKVPPHQEPTFVEPDDLTSYLIKILSSWNVCSKEWIIRQYDHEVQGGSVLKPLQGVSNDGPGDASITKPLLYSNKGIIISCGINPNYGLIDPYWMAASCIDEALRQIIAVGGNLKQVALLDNFCWPNTNEPDRLGSLVRAALGCYDIARGYEVPFISGKDSLNNEYVVEGKSMAISPTLLISAMAVIEDVEKAVSMDAKKEGDLIYIVGLTKNELGGSEYLRLRKKTSSGVPKVDTAYGKKLMDSLSEITAQGLVRAVHDCSEGGMAVACAEMAFSGGLGMEICLKEVPKAQAILRNDVILFSESNSRFIVEIAKEDQKMFEQRTEGLTFGLIGHLTKTRKFRIYGLDGEICLSTDIDELKNAWQKPFRNW